MGAAASIIGGAASAAAQGGQKDNTNSNNASNVNPVSNAENQTPEMKTAEVKGAATSNSGNDNGNGTNWAQLASLAQSLYQGQGGRSQDVTVNPASQTSPVANFR